MSVKILALSSVAGLFFIGSAQALTLTNNDPQTHNITIIENGKNRDLTVQSKEKLEGLCQSSCVLRLNNSEDEEYEIESGEVVSIEGGILMSDGNDQDQGSGPSHDDNTPQDEEPAQSDDNSSDQPAQD